MAFTPEEKEIIARLKAEGKSPLEVGSLIVDMRNGQRRGTLARGITEEKSLDKRTSLIAQLSGQVEEPKVESVFTKIAKDIPNDIKTFFNNSVESVSKGIQTARETRERVAKGETGVAGGTLQTLGSGLRAGAEVVGGAALSVPKLFMSQEAEDVAQQGFQSVAEGAIQTAPVQAGIQAFEGLEPETQRNIVGGLGVLEGVTTITGFGPVLNKLTKVVKPQTVKLLNESDDVLKTAKKQNFIKEPIIDPTQPVTPNILNSIKSKINDFRVEISDIDPQVETALKRSDFNDVNKHFQAAKNAKIDPRKDTPIEIVGSQAETAYTTIKQATSKAVDGKKSILADKGNQRAPGNMVNEVMADSIQRFNNKFGVEVSPTGVIKQKAGRFAQLDKGDAKLVGEFYKRLNSLGVSPTLKQIDDFVDWSQSQLYKQSKSLSKLETAAEPVIRELRQTTGDLNTRLKTEVGNGYGEVNERISNLLELQDEINRGLGADARKGGGFVKRLFSPTGGNTRRIFDQIQKETGIDLFKEATLAKFAMESVGDVRQQSLLKGLDIAVKEGAELNLTKPMSVIRFIRERADMDGQELANELIKKFQTKKKVYDPTKKGGYIKIGKSEKPVEPKSKVNESVSSLNNSTLLKEAKKYKSADEFVEKIQGSATQYRDYVPNTRIAGMEGYRNITELGIKPDEMVTVYRGIDDVSGKVKRQINDGDFVTTDFDSALSYTGSREDVVSMKVPAKTLYTDAVEDFSDEPFYVGAEYVYTTKEVNPLTKSQLKEIWEKANGKK